MKKTVFSALWLLFACQIAYADTDYRGLMLQAMKSPDGTYQEEVTGPIADVIRKQIHRPKAKVLATVTTVEALPQEGCKRFNIRFTTPGTYLPTKDSGNQPLSIDTRFNMCANGAAPGAEEVEEPVSSAPSKSKKRG